ncbi:universal stress protein [Leucobacter sp. CSA1]|uniref:Universal stress protein n=1 Tax=Leucobacter chromiisoli TaxID=2796471 RepID=A0A934Q5V8_9MICO|nr:universal stress protein [Leucobacter chromiisoli]MBK0418950.1 universal stress protein [Leucobacter chromiisoli]
MTIVVGVAPGHCSRAAVHLGALLARSSELPLVAVAVNSAAWSPGRTLSGVDGEYRRFVAEQAASALDEASALMPADIDASYRVHDASSARRGLLEVCEQLGASRLVVGAKAEGAEDEIVLGSVVTGLLQSAHLPVAIAPHGFEPPEGARIERVTAAYSGSETSAELVLGAAAIAAEAGEGIRIASFRTRPRAFAMARVGQAVEDQISAEWEELIREDTAEILEEIGRFARQPASVEVAVGAGDDWRAALRALDWRDAEVLVVGSSSLGPLSRISLGSHAVKIVRHSPVPVVMVPRRATDEYAARARHA